MVNLEALDPKIFKLLPLVPTYFVLQINAIRAMYFFYRKEKYLKIFLCEEEKLLLPSLHFDEFQSTCSYTTLLLFHIKKRIVIY
jgi:hypothetical protein